MLKLQAAPQRRPAKKASGSLPPTLQHIWSFCPANSQLGAKRMTPVLYGAQNQATPLLVVTKVAGSPPVDVPASSSGTGDVQAAKRPRRCTGRIMSGSTRSVKSPLETGHMAF